MEVEHVKSAPHREGQKKEMTQFQKFVTVGNEKADGVGKGRSDVGWRIRGGNESKDSPAGARRGVRSCAERSQLSLFGGRMERL